MAISSSAFVGRACRPRALLGVRCWLELRTLCSAWSQEAVDRIWKVQFLSRFKGEPEVLRQAWGS